MSLVDDPLALGIAPDAQPSEIHKTLVFKFFVSQSKACLVCLLPLSLRTTGERHSNASCRGRDQWSRQKEALQRRVLIRNHRCFS
jgi:hypothetical protein